MRLNPKTAALATTLALAAAGSARAQQQPPAEEVAAGRTASSGVSADPNIDRGFILPTAMTQPAGSVTYNNYELLLHGVTYGLTDDVQATVTVLPPIVSDMPLIGAVAIKARISPVEHVHLAVQGSLGVIHDQSVANDSGSTNSATVVSFGAGGYASVCLRDDCASLLNVSANYQYASAGGHVGGAQLLVYGGSLVVRATEHLKLLGEITSAATQEDYGSFKNAPGFLAGYGVRFHYGRVAADVGFIKPVITSSDLHDDLVLGLPFVNVSYRWA